MRWVMARVLPVPAPARMQTGPRTASAAHRCSGSRPASTASAEPWTPWTAGTAWSPETPAATTTLRSCPMPPTVRCAAPGSAPGVLLNRFTSEQAYFSNTCRWQLLAAVGIFAAQLLVSSKLTTDRRLRGNTNGHHVHDQLVWLLRATEEH